MTREEEEFRRFVAGMTRDLKKKKERKKWEKH